MGGEILLSPPAQKAAGAEDAAVAGTLVWRRPAPFFPVEEALRRALLSQRRLLPLNLVSRGLFCGGLLDGRRYIG
jgi:hypothetical protein